MYLRVSVRTVALNLTSSVCSFSRTPTTRLAPLRLCSLQEEDAAEEKAIKEAHEAKVSSKTVASKYWFGETKKAGHADADEEVEELIDDASVLSTPQSRKALELKRKAKMARIDLGKRLEKERESKSASVHKRIAAKRRIAMTFRKYDTSGDGTIDVAELTALLIGELNPTEDQLPLIISAIMDTCVVLVLSSLLPCSLSLSLSLSLSPSLSLSIFTPTYSSLF